MIDESLSILGQIPVELVDEITDFIYDERGYSYERYEEFKRENDMANRRIVNELKMLYRTYFWERFEESLKEDGGDPIDPYIRLSYVRQKNGFYDIGNLNYILRLEVDNMGDFSSYWVRRRQEFLGMSEKERMIEMERSVFKYIDNCTA